MITLLVKALSFAYAAEARKLNKKAQKLFRKSRNLGLDAVRLAKECGVAREASLDASMEAHHTIDRVAFHSSKAEQVKASFLGE